MSASTVTGCRRAGVWAWWLALAALLFVQMSGWGQVVSPGNGGGGGGGSGIQSNGGAGILNTFTNAVLATAGNNSAFLTLTNDSGFSSTAATLEFYGIGTGNTNDGAIYWNGPAGPYGFIDMLGNHDGNPAAPAKTELRIESANRISLIPNTYGGGDNNGIEVGLGNMVMYMNPNSNQFAPPFASGSEPFVFRAAAYTNGNALEFDPGFMSAWLGGSNSFVAHFYIFADTGNGGFGGGLSGTTVDVNKQIPAIDISIGTNGGYFQQTFLEGRTATSTNSLMVGAGANTNTGYFLANTASYSSDAWEAPHFFGAGGASSAGEAFDVNGNFVEVGEADSSAAFHITGASEMFRSGGGYGYTAVPTLGLTVGQATACTNGNDLELIGSGKAVIPTNTAALTTVSNFALSVGTYTNFSGCIVSAEVTVSGLCTGGSPGSCSSIFNVTNNGVAKPAKIFEISTSQAVAGYQFISFRLGPMDTFGYTTNAVGAGSTNGTVGNMTFTTDP